jgi:hypothetical protein
LATLLDVALLEKVPQEWKKKLSTDGRLSMLIDLEVQEDLNLAVTGKVFKLLSDAGN